MSPVRVRLGPLYGSVAQSVEQGTENPRVAGSIPALGIKNFRDSILQTKELSFLLYRKVIE